jgi:hypothetical protein
MNQLFHVWSQEFLWDPSFADPTTVLMCELDWNDLNRELQVGGEASRIFVKLVVSGEDSSFDSDGKSPSEELSIICSVGAPVRQVDVTRNAMFLPLWILDRLGVAGCGNEILAQFFLKDAFTEATRIVLRPHNSQFYDVQDVKSDLEGALTRVGVVERGKTVMLPLSELGGELLAFDVVSTEPASVVLCQGDEVAIEFEAAWDAPAPPAVAAAEPVPEPEPFVPPNARQNPWRHKDFVPPYARDGKSSG